MSDDMSIRLAAVAMAEEDWTAEVWSLAGIRAAREFAEKVTPEWVLAALHRLDAAEARERILRAALRNALALIDGQTVSVGSEQAMALEALRVHRRAIDEIRQALAAAPAPGDAR